MSERASERTRAAESEEASEPAGGENVSRAENRRKRKTRSFGVESKSFVLEMEERRGKTLITITESKKGVSSWVRMGMYSVGLFMEGLHQCIEDVKEGSGKRVGRRRGGTFLWCALRTGGDAFCGWGLLIWS